MSSGPTAATVSTNIARLRKEAGLSFAELARRLEARGHPIPPLGLRRIEAGERRVDVDDLVSLALALDVNPNALLLPSIESTDDEVEVTGATRPTTSHLAWSWARGHFSLALDMGSLPADGKRLSPQAHHGIFRERVKPRRLLTADERHALRSRWIAREIEDLTGQIARDRADQGVEDGDSWHHTAEDDIEQLRDLDPTDDATWAARDFDPAPPSMEKDARA